MIRLSLLLLPLLLFADIDEEIEAIQHASVKERFKLMNAFKNRVIQMREEERLQALHKLQSMTKEKASIKSMQNFDKQLPEDLVQQQMDEEKIELPNEEAHEREENEQDDNKN